MKILYTTRATATGGRSGRSQLDDGSLGFDLTMPGSGKAGANPEQLFAIGYAACFDSALALTAQRMKKAISGSRTSAAHRPSFDIAYFAPATPGSRKIAICSGISLS